MNQLMAFNFSNVESRLIEIVKLLNVYTKSNDVDITFLASYEQLQLIMDNVDLSKHYLHCDEDLLLDLQTNNENPTMLLAFIDDNVFLEKPFNDKGEILKDEGGNILVILNEIDELAEYHISTHDNPCVVEVDEEKPLNYREFEGWFKKCLLK